MNGRLLRWLLAVAAPRRARGGPPRLTIVRHHRVYPVGEQPLNRLGVAESVLDAQLETLARAHLTPISVAEGLSRLASGVGGHHVAFSYDDGYLDNVTRALPALARHGAKATFYLTAGLMGERRAPWWDELTFVLEACGRDDGAVVIGGQRVGLALGGRLGRSAALAALLPLMRVPPDEQRRRLAQLREATSVETVAPCALATWDEARAFVSAGMEVGAHTMSHPFLSLLPAEEQRIEISRSIDELTARLGVRPIGLAYPNGDHDAHTVEAARAAGLDYAVTTRAGDVEAASDRFRLRRRGLPEGACLRPDGRFSRHMTLAEVEGAFDRLRTRTAEWTT